MVENANALVFLVLENTVQLDAVSVELRQVQRPKVLVVALVNQHIIDVEEEAVWHVLGRIRIAEPIQPVYQNI